MENKRKESYGITDFIKEPIGILCIILACLVLFVVVVTCIGISDPDFQQKMQQEEQQSKVEAQVQPEKTMVSCINDNGTKVKNSSKELEAIEPSDALIFFFVCLELVVAVFACVILFSNCTCGCCESGGTRRDNRDCNSRYYFTRRKDPSYPESYYRHFGELWSFFLSRHPEYNNTYVEDLDERGKRAFSEVRKYYYNLHPFERRNWSQGGSIGASGLA